MLAKQLAIGSGPSSLVSYLFGPGRHNEHTDQRLIAASPALMAGYVGVDLAGDGEGRALLAREFDGAWRRIRREQGLPLQAAENDPGVGSARAERVFHAMLSLRPNEGSLSEEEWSRAAAMFVKEMGFVDSPDGADCAWLAVHHGRSQHGNDHLHIAVSLVRDDGRRANVHQSKRRTAQAGARVAGAMGKDIAFDKDLSSGIGNIPRAEWERSQREQRDADRVLLRRRLAGAALGASSEADFVRSVRSAGVLLRPRFTKGGITRVEGYSVALETGQHPVWFAPSKLDRSLGLPVLRDRYGWTLDQQLEAVPVWRDATAKQATTGALRLPVVEDVERIRREVVQDNPHMHWRRAAQDVSALLGTWSVHADDPKGGPLGRASDALAKASQPVRGTPRQALLEGASAVMAMKTAASKNPAEAQLALLMQMMRLVEDLANLAEARHERALTQQHLTSALTPMRAQAQVLGIARRGEQFSAMDTETQQSLLTALGDPREPRRKGTETTEAQVPPAPMRKRPAKGRHIDLDRPDDHER